MTVISNPKQLYLTYKKRNQKYVWFYKPNFHLSFNLFFYLSYIVAPAPHTRFLFANEKSILMFIYQVFLCFWSMICLRYSTGPSTWVVGFYKAFTHRCKNICTQIDLVLKKIPWHFINQNFIHFDQQFVFNIHLK